MFYIVKILNKINFIIGVFRGILINLFYPNVSIGKNTYIGKHVVFDVLLGGRIKIGNNCYILSNSQFRTYGGDIFIGDYCTINSFCVIYGQGNTIIGNFVRIATGTNIIPSNHTFSDKSLPIAIQPLKKIGIIIDNNVWIGSNASILDGVKISEGTVLAAGAVLKSSTDSYSIYGGVPAKKIKNY